jgi:hypothetical protein
MKINVKVKGIDHGEHGGHGEKLLDCLIPMVAPAPRILHNTPGAMRRNKFSFAYAFPVLPVPPVVKSLFPKNTPC